MRPNTLFLSVALAATAASCGEGGEADVAEEQVENPLAYIPMRGDLFTKIEGLQGFGSPAEGGGLVSIISHVNPFGARVVALEHFGYKFLRWSGCSPVDILGQDPTNSVLEYPTRVVLPETCIGIFEPVQGVPPLGKGAAYAVTGPGIVKSSGGFSCSDDVCNFPSGSHVLLEVPSRRDFEGKVIDINCGGNTTETVYDSATDMWRAGVVTWNSSTTCHYFVDEPT
jgi:hypothetical protein